jgi:glycosyltransferase involved in cell wall biosynthesis
LRILVVNWQDRENPHAGGAEFHLHEVFGRLVQMGHSVDLLCSGFNTAPDRAILDGIRIFRTGSRYTFPLYAHRGYKQLLALNAAQGLPDYDVVIEDLNKVPLYTKRWNTKRLVVLTHHLFGTTAFREESFFVAAATWLSERPLALGYRGVPFQAVSQSTAQDLMDRGIAADCIQVIYNGVDLHNFTRSPNERSPGPLFAYLGRLKRYKRVDLVIRAFALLDDPVARLDIAGKGDDRDRLGRLVYDLGLGDRVRFLGYISEMEKQTLLRRAWATVLASPKEGWGISNLESAACGTPVIAADAPGIRESVVNGETGFLVPGSDVASYAAAMRGLIDSPDMVEALGDNARRFAETFSWERAARETEAHLTNVIRTP